MAENRQHRRRYGHRHRDHRGVEAEQRVQPLHHQHQVDDVEAGEHEQRRQQHQDHPAITELRAGLDHLRQAKVRALRAVKRHEQRAEHDAQRAGERGPERGQADAWANEADGHGEEGEIAEEPERALARQFVGALVLGDEVDRMPLDDGFFIEAGHARGGLGVSVHDGLLLLEDHDEITAFFRVNDSPVALKMGLLRSPAGASSLATGSVLPVPTWRCCWNRKPVGASLLAIAEGQATQMSNVQPSSRASSLPQELSQP
ncbi:hypothetical protein D3C71_1141390 [compost metagenome]